jgi:protein-tyrosine phosphatase
MRSDAPRPRLRRRIVLGLACLLVVAGVVALIGREFWFQRYGVVKEGVLYRSAVLGEDALREKVRKERAKTLVNLCDLQEADLAVAKSEGIRYVWIPSEQVPTDENADKFVALVSDPANQPVHVHCEHGVGRTGVMVALYRTLVEGWALDDAIAEARRYALYGSFGEGSDKTQFLRRFVPERLARKGTVPPPTPAEPAPAGMPEPR